MSKPSIEKALAELHAADAINLPSEWEIEEAEIGSIWKGMKENGSEWQLIKNANDSFECYC